MTSETISLKPTLFIKSTISTIFKLGVNLMKAPLKILLSVIIKEFLSSLSVSPQKLQMSRPSFSNFIIFFR